MGGWHHRLNGNEFEWTLGDGEGQGGLACCNPWGRKESERTDNLSIQVGQNQIVILGSHRRQDKIRLLFQVLITPPEGTID